MISKSIFVTGGAGYVGSALIPELLSNGYKVTVYDIMYFGDSFLPKKNPNLKVIKGDIREVSGIKFVARRLDGVPARALRGLAPRGCGRAPPRAGALCRPCCRCSGGGVIS